MTLDPPPRIPIHRIMHDAGYDQFFFHLADMLDLADELQQA